MSAPVLDSVAIVTVSYNSSRHLRGFLASLVAGEGEGLHIVIADNASSDLDATRAIADDYGARLVELPDNRGYGGAVNAGVKALDPEIDLIVIANPDIEIAIGAVAELAATMRRFPDAGSVGPSILNLDGTVYPSARQIPSLRTGIGHALFSRSWPRNPWSRRYRFEQAPSEELRDVGWLSGAFVMVRRAAFDAVGGFDEGYFMYFEDVDLGYRLGKAGWRNVYAPNAVVTHSGAHSTKTESARMLQAHHDSAYRFLEKKYRGPLLAPLRLVLKWALAVRSAWETRGRRS